MAKDPPVSIHHFAGYALAVGALAWLSGAGVTPLVIAGAATYLGAQALRAAQEERPKTEGRK